MSRISRPACGWPQRPSEHYFSDGRAGHDIAAMPLWVEQSESLSKGEAQLTRERYKHSRVLSGNLHRLPGFETR